MDSRDVVVTREEDAPYPYEGFWTLVMMHEPTGKRVKHMAAVPYVTYDMYEKMYKALDDIVAEATDRSGVWLL